jgi:trigger factor
MKINVETTSPVERKLSIEVDPDRIALELDKAYSSLSRRVKLKGFRPGHVPRAVLERNFRAEVEGDVVEKLVSSTFVEAALAEGVDAVAPPQVSVDGKLEPGSPFRFTAKVEVKPALQPKDYKGLTVTRTAPVVTDATVEAELEKVREARSQLVPIEGREVAEEGDYAVIDHLGTIDGKPFDGSDAQDVNVRAAAGKIEEGCIPALVGQRLGAVVEIEEPFPEDHRNEQLRGKLARMKVTLKGLRAKQAPPLDDALAGLVGIEGVTTLDGLRARIRADLEKREKRKAEVELKDALIKAALAKNDFEVPPSLVERAIDTMLEGTLERFARMGVDVRQLDLDVARLRGDLREQALLQVRGGLLLEAIADLEKVAVTEEDLQAEVAKAAEEMGVPLQKVQQQLRGKEARAALSSRVREEKALSLLAQSATYQS